MACMYRIMSEVSKMKHALTAALSTAAILCAGAASAATYTFTLNESGDAITRLSDNSFEIDKDVEGVTLTGTFAGLYIDGAVFSGDTLSGGSVDPARSLDRWYTGAGVCGAGSCFDIDTRHTVDGVSDGSADFDMIEMSFSTAEGAVDVTLTELVFGYVGVFPYGGRYYGYSGTNGSFEILTDASGDDAIGLNDFRTYSGIAPSVYQNGSVNLDGISGLTDSHFGVKAGENGSWKLLSATVSYSVASINEVPLPAGGLLLIAGLGGLAALRRARSST